MAKTIKPPSFAEAPAPAARSAAPLPVTAVLPEIAALQRGTPPSTAPARPRFVLGHHPLSWTVIDDGKRLVPYLTRAPFLPGVNGAMSAANGKINVSELKVNMEQQGIILIPYTALPPAHKALGYTSYLVTPNDRPDLHITYCERVYAGSAVVEIDHQRYAEFCEHLVSSGMIPPCAGHVIRSLIRKHTALLDAHSDRARNNSRAQREAEKQQRILDTLRAALSEAEKRESAPTAAPDDNMVEGL